MKFEIEDSLTYDDLLLVPQYSEVIPSQISTENFFGKSIRLHAPIISSAMDTVTESQMARVLAQNGGLGIIHKNLSLEEQVGEVEKVKKYESGMILDPITLGPNALLEEAFAIMEKFSVSGVPITENGFLVGILTNRDVRFETNLKQPISKFMTPKQELITAPIGISLEDAKFLLHKHRIEKLPVVDDQQRLKGLITIKDIEKAKIYPLASKDGHGRLIVGAAVGVDQSSKDRVVALVAQGCDVIVIDTAHGHSKNVLEMAKWVSTNFKDIVLVAGNVVTAEATEALFSHGADVVKVGVGPGSICTTRIIAGVGMAQASAVIKCSEVARRHSKTIIADGGIKFSGDICKAFALGANSVMIGNILAGTEESPGEMVLLQGRTYKTYRGMGSLSAMAKGSKDRYSQGDVEDSNKLVPEGIEGRVPFRGSAANILHQLLGGVRAGMGYVGANTIEELQEKAKFVRISSAGLRESHVHDVAITKEAPNYRIE